MLGVTISLNERTADENLSYLKEMKQLGCELIFTSLRIPEENSQVIKASVEALGDYIGKNYQSFVVDVSPRAFELFSIDWMKENYIDTLRIDNGVDEESIVSLSKDFNVIFNASTLTSKSINKLIDLGYSKEFIAWHNYYPRKNTGLDEKYFVEQNEMLRTNGVKVGAYISGDLTPRGTIYEWLPTLERHRNTSPFSSYLELKDCFKVETIVFGDYGLKPSTKKKFERFFSDETVLLDVINVSDTRILGIKLRNRIDVCQDAIRSVEIKRNISDKIAPQNNEQNRGFGDVTIDNLFYGRYMGELQIVLTQLPSDSRVNVVGKVIDNDLPLLNLLKYNRYEYEFCNETIR